MTDTTIDIAYEGYSVVMGGFTIYVPDERAIEASRIIADYVRVVGGDTQGFTQKLYLQRFYMAAIFSITLPIIMHFAGVYYLWKGLKKREPVKVPTFVGALVLFITSGTLGTIFVIGLVKKYVLE